MLTKKSGCLFPDHDSSRSSHNYVSWQRIVYAADFRIRNRLLCILASHLGALYSAQTRQGPVDVDSSDYLCAFLRCSVLYDNGQTEDTAKSAKPAVCFYQTV